MSWEICWADMCRACMDIEGELLPLYDEQNEADENDLSRKIAELSGIEISRSDGLPTKLCAKCAYYASAFTEFKNMVRDTDKKLRDMFNEQLVLYEAMENEENNQRDNEFQVFSSQETEEIVVQDKNLKANGKSMENISNIDLNEVLKTTEENVNVPVVVNNLEEVALELEHNDTVILKLDPSANKTLGVNEEMQDLHVVFHKDQVADIERLTHTELGDNQNNYIIKESEAAASEQTISVPLEEIVSSKTKRSNRKKNTKAKNKKDCKKIIDEAIEDEMLQKAIEAISQPQDDSSDSDCDTNDHGNVVGTLNDTITKVKEIKEGGKVVQHQCTLCLKNYPILSEALNHIVDLHVPSTGPFYCVVCEKDCDSIKKLKTHIKVHRGPTPYKCFLCNKAYVMKRYLKRHMACHTEFPRHRCTKCGERFKVKSELEIHIKSHIEGAPFKCNQCPRVFNHKGNFKRHLICHLDPQGLHLPKYPCTVCKRRFLNNRTLVTHMRVHTGEKPYKCEECGKAFSQQGNLMNHQKIHSNPRSFTCEVCGKSFNQKATLRDHSLLHSGEKPYVCNVCGIAFTFTASLRRHMWTHTEAKPFECDTCNATFVGRYDLKRHMKIHNERSKVKSKSKHSKIPKKPQNENKDQPSEEIINIIEGDPIANADTIFVEQIFVCDDAIQIVTQEECEKENVDSLLGLTQYS